MTTYSKDEQETANTILSLAYTLVSNMEEKSDLKNISQVISLLKMKVEDLEFEIRVRRIYFE